MFKRLLSMFFRPFMLLERTTREVEMWRGSASPARLLIGWEPFPRDRFLAGVKYIYICVYKILYCGKVIYFIEFVQVGLLQALAGDGEMDEVLDDVALSLFIGKLPIAWQKLAPATCKKLGDWVVHFLKRTREYDNWVSI